MKAKIIFLGLITLYCSCQEAISKGRPFPEVNTDSVTVIPTDEEHAEVIKVSDNVKSKVLSSELIEDFYYIPLETTDESLFAYCNNLEFYEDKIYLFDRLGAEKLFIFDKYGKFLNYVGDKGGASYEFYAPKAFAVNRTNKQFVIYDNQKRKWMVFTDKGDFITSYDVNFRMKSCFQILPNGEYVSFTDAGDRNYHLGKYADYKVLYTDTLGRLLKAAYTFPEKVYTTIVYDPLIWANDELLYFSLYRDKVYTLKDSIFEMRYKFDYSDFSPFKEKDLEAFENYEDFYRYCSSHTYLSGFAENSTHLFLKTSSEDGKDFVSFYDKRSKKMISWYYIYYDMDFALEFMNNIFSYKDYFVALVEPETLKGLKKHIETTTHYPMKEENRIMIESLKEDDNMVLVFFKVKTL